MITFKVIPDGAGPYEVTATSRDVLVWEKTNRGKTFIGLMNDMNMVDIYKLAHLASWRQQLFTGSVTEFEESCEVTFDLEEQEQEPDPTRPAPSAEPSSPSPSAPASAQPRGRKKANGR